MQQQVWDIFQNFNREQLYYIIIYIIFFCGKVISVLSSISLEKKILEENMENVTTFKTKTMRLVWLSSDSYYAWWIYHVKFMYLRNSPVGKLRYLSILGHSGILPIVLTTSSWDEGSQASIYDFLPFDMAHVTWGFHKTRNAYAVSVLDIGVFGLFLRRIRHFQKTTIVTNNITIKFSRNMRFKMTALKSTESY